MLFLPEGDPAQDLCHSVVSPPRVVFDFFSTSPARALRALLTLRALRAVLILHALRALLTLRLWETPPSRGLTMFLMSTTDWYDRHGLV
jgi:hypothetical protein